MIRWQPREVATVRVGGYQPRMVALRLMRFLTLFALLLAPFGMMSAHARMSAPVPDSVRDHMSAMTADHCADLDPSGNEQRPPGIDCTIACSAVASLEGTFVPHTPVAAPAAPIALAPALHGLHPESDPPPPRLS